MNKQVIMLIFLCCFLIDTNGIAQNEAIVIRHNGVWNKIVMPLVVSDRVIDSTFESSFLMYLDKIHINKRFVNQVRVSDSLINLYDLYLRFEESLKSVEDSSSFSSKPGSFEILFIKQNTVSRLFQTNDLNQTRSFLQKVLSNLESDIPREEIEKFESAFNTLLSNFDEPIYREVLRKE